MNCSYQLIVVISYELVSYLLFYFSARCVTLKELFVCKNSILMVSIEKISFLSFIDKSFYKKQILMMLLRLLPIHVLFCRFLYEYIFSVSRRRTKEVAKKTLFQRRLSLTEVFLFPSCRFLFRIDESGYMYLMYAFSFRFYVYIL